MPIYFRMPAARFVSMPEVISLQEKRGHCRHITYCLDMVRFFWEHKNLLFGCYCKKGGNLLFFFLFDVLMLSYFGHTWRTVNSLAYM